MKQYALNDTVHELLSTWAVDPEGSLLITGPPGSGLTTALRYVVVSIYGNRPRPGEVIYLTDYSIETVRQCLKELSRTRVNQLKPRLVVIDDADKLGIEAQNTLLKALEEPPNNSHFLLGSQMRHKLLPTIVSRCQLIQLKRPLKSDLRTIYKQVEEQTFNNAYTIADGWPADLAKMLDNQESDIKRQIDSAKEFLTAKPAQRIINLKKTDNQEYFEDLLSGLIKVSHAALRSTAKAGDKQASSNWQQRAIYLHQIQQSFDKRVNHKLLGLSLAFLS